MISAMIIDSMRIRWMLQGVVGGRFWIAEMVTIRWRWSGAIGGSLGFLGFLGILRPHRLMGHFRCQLVVAAGLWRRWAILAPVVYL